MNYYKRALELKEETIANRRYLHEHAETGLHLENTVEFVMKRLTEYGLNPERCGEGVTALLGQGFHVKREKCTPADMIFTLPCSLVRLRC